MYAAVEGKPGGDSTEKRPRESRTNCGSYNIYICIKEQETAREEFLMRSLSFIAG